MYGRTLREHKENRIALSDFRAQRTQRTLSHLAETITLMTKPEIINPRQHTWFILKLHLSIRVKTNLQMDINSVRKGRSKHITDSTVTENPLHLCFS
jgi:hypothetical protein